MNSLRRKIAGWISLKLWIGLAVVAVAGCSTVEKYYIRNMTTRAVTVYIRGDQAATLAKNVRVHTDNILHALSLPEARYELEPVTGADGSGSSFTIPPLSVAYVGTKSKEQKELNSVTLFTAEGTALLWVRHESAAPPYIYYFDFK